MIKKEGSALFFQLQFYDSSQGPNHDIKNNIIIIHILLITLLYHFF